MKSNRFILVWLLGYITGILLEKLIQDEHCCKGGHDPNNTGTPIIPDFVPQDLVERFSK